MIKKVIIILIVVGGVIFFFGYINKPLWLRVNVDQDGKDVEYITGCHHEVWREDGYIAYREDVTLENKTDYDLWGYLVADVRREKRFIDEEYIDALDRETGEKYIQYIPAHTSVTVYDLYFRAKSSSDTEVLRTDRNPLYDVIFEEVKRKEPNEETAPPTSP